jgi:hypothetical protein
VVTSTTLPIFINGSAVQARPGSSLGEVLADHDADLLATLLDGTGQVTDARGLAIDPDAPVHAGAIYRIFRSSRRDETTNA